MEIRYKPSAVKQIKKLPLTEKKKIVKKIELLSQDPYVGKALKGEFSSLYSLRAWPYRIVYSILKKKIVIHTVSHRQSGYKS